MEDISSDEEIFWSETKMKPYAERSSDKFSPNVEVVGPKRQTFLAENTIGNELEIIQFQS